MRPRPDKPVELETYPPNTHPSEGTQNPSDGKGQTGEGTGSGSATPPMSGGDLPPDDGDKRQEKKDDKLREKPSDLSHLSKEDHKAVRSLESESASINKKP